MPALGSSFVPAIHYTSTTHGDAHHPSSSNPNGKHNLPQQVTNLTNTLAQQTTLVNQLFECIEMRRIPDEVSRSRTRAVERDLFQRRPGSGAGQHRRQLEDPLPHQAQIHKEVQRLIAEQLRGFRLIDTTDDTLRRDVANLSRSPFTNEIERTKPLRKFNPPHFILFRGYEDPGKHLMHYQNAITLYASNDTLMCKIFATTIQGKAQDWFHTLPPHSIRNFDELSLVFTKEYSSYRLIKKKSDHLFSMKNDLNESLYTYVNRFKAEKAKIPLEMLLKDTEPTRKKASDKLFNNKSKPGDKRRDRSPAKGSTTPKPYTRFLVPVSQILYDLKNKPWFKPPPPLKGDTFKMDQTKYCAFHRGLGHITNDCTTWTRYLEQLIKEGKCDQYVNRPTARPR
ncbi:uncharacterized protein LOC126592216 [Malus sylvestris]|uniref:uncharacterized protein LOC126592216 n=1 Tax=Malus sylvestris TaxID=3752 RepID=UPI0021ACA94B|nr:uncharacterized protein LOC126592216 [Malus sylvestris]